MFNKLKPIFLEIQDFSRHIKKLRIVSDSFKGMDLTERMNMLEYLADEKFCYIYEPFTVEEWMRIKEPENPLTRLEYEGGIVGLSLVWEGLVDVRKLVMLFGEDVRSVLKLEGDFVQNVGQIAIFIQCIEIVMELEGDLNWFWLYRPEFNQSPMEEIGQGKARRVLKLLEQLR